jgi:hypothetical protein
MTTVSQLGDALRSLVTNDATRALGADHSRMGHWSALELLDGGYDPNLMAAAIHELGSYSSYDLV